MNAETFSSGLAHKLFLAAEPKGWTPALMNQLAENPDLLGKFLEVLEGRSKIVPAPLVDFIGTVAGDLSATEPFDVEKHYAVDMAPDALVKIRYVNEFFKACFYGRVEPATDAGMTLRYGDLSRDSKDGPIITELGGSLKARATLAAFFAHIAAQGRGQKDGPLYVDGRANVIYVEDEVRSPEDEQVAYTN